jgi:uncharacterized integral membrane protein
MAILLGVATTLALVVLGLVVVAQNRQDAKINFLGVHASAPVGLLIALGAIGGIALVALTPAVVLLQPSRTVRRQRQSRRRISVWLRGGPVTFVPGEVAWSNGPGAL